MSSIDICHIEKINESCGEKKMFNEREKKYFDGGHKRRSFCWSSPVLSALARNPNRKWGSTFPLWKQKIFDWDSAHCFDALRRFHEPLNDRYPLNDDVPMITYWDCCRRVLFEENFSLITFIWKVVFIPESRKIHLTVQWWEVELNSHRYDSYWWQ